MNWSVRDIHDRVGDFAVECSATYLRTCIRRSRSVRCKSLGGCSKKRRCHCCSSSVRSACTQARASDWTSKQAVDVAAEAAVDELEPGDAGERHLMVVSDATVKVDDPVAGGESDAA